MKVFLFCGDKLATLGQYFSNCAVTSDAWCIFLEHQFYLKGKLSRTLENVDKNLWKSIFNLKHMCKYHGPE